MKDPIPITGNYWKTLQLLGDIMSTSKATLLVLISALLTGCAHVPDKGASKFSPNPLFSRPLENIDIIALLGGDSSDIKDDNDFVTRFDEALHAHSGVGDRDRIQDRIIMASNILCEDYKTVLKKKQSHVNFWTGSAGVIFGAAGGVVGGARAAKNLAALSGISSGVRAEYNEDFYSAITAQLIANGIDSRRKDILEQINAARDGDKYTLEAAIADAVVYHGACSLVSGLAQADAALKNLKENAGLDALAANPAFKKMEEEKKLGLRLPRHIRR